MRNLKQFSLLTVLLLALGLGLGLVAQARDPGDAWPWGSEMPFPWNGIKGTWVAQGEGASTYFTFKKVRMPDGGNQLQVKQYETSTCKLLASGVGYEEDRVVKAVLLTRSVAFELTVHVFRQSDLISADSHFVQKAESTKTVTVMSMASLADANQRLTIELQKVDADPFGICTDQNLPRH